MPRAIIIEKEEEEKKNNHHRKSTKTLQIKNKNIAKIKKHKKTTTTRPRMQHGTWK